MVVKKQNKNMNVLTSNSQAEMNYKCAAEDIMNLMDNYRFSTDVEEYNVEHFKSIVADIIRKNIEGNVIINYVK